MEKRRLASYDEALFIITTSPLDIPPNCPRPSSLPNILPSGDSWYFPRLWPTDTQVEAKFAKAVCCYRLYGDITLKLRRTENSLARARSLGNEVGKDRSAIANLTLSGPREPFRDVERAVGVHI